MEVTVRVEWDMGHRLPHHDGLCKNLHGHRYVADVSLDGRVNATPGHPQEGMVADFIPVKAAIRAVLAALDHQFLVQQTDPLAALLAPLPGVQLVPFVPTAENLARYLLKQCQLALAPRLAGDEPALVVVSSVRLYETPTAWAEAIA